MTGWTKRAIGDHLDAEPALDRVPRQKGRDDMADLIRPILPSHVTRIYIRQAKVFGLGYVVG